MKKQRILTLSLVMLLWSCGVTSAQFFKKLKNSVNMAVNSIQTDASSGQNAGNPAGNTVKGTTSDLSAYSPSTLCTLQPGEQFDFSESCLLLAADLLDPQVIVKKELKRYVIRPDGSRVPLTNDLVRGCPYPGMEEKDTRLVELSDFLSRAQDKSAATGDNDINQYVRLSINDKRGAGSYIDYNHKSYGPFGAVTSMIFDKDRNRFKAVVMVRPSDSDSSNVLHFMLISSDGQKMKLPFTYVCYIIPYGGFDNPRVIGSSMNDLTHQILYDPGTGQSIRIIHEDNGNAHLYLDKNNGALLYASQGKVYIDEKLVKTLPAGSQIKAQDVFVSPDHTHWALFSNTGMYFSDNKVVDGVISSKYQLKNGAGVLSWMVLGQDNKTLYLCHEAL